MRGRGDSDAEPPPDDARVGGRGAQERLAARIIAEEEEEVAGKGGTGPAFAMKGSAGSLAIAPPPPPRHGGQAEDTAMALNIGNLMSAGTLNVGVEAFKFGKFAQDVSQTMSADGKTTTILDYIVEAFH